MTPSRDAAGEGSDGQARPRSRARDRDRGRRTDGADAPWFAVMSPRPAVVGRSGRAGRYRRVRRVVAHPAAGHDITAGVFGDRARASWPARSRCSRRSSWCGSRSEIVEDQVAELAAPATRNSARSGVALQPRDRLRGRPGVRAAAEERGAWDARLEALVVDTLARGDPDEALLSRAGALGWSGHTGGRGRRRHRGRRRTQRAVDEIRRVARRDGFDVLAGVGGRRLVCVVGVEGDPMPAAALLAGLFAPGPVVLGPAVADLAAAARRLARPLAGLERRRRLAGRAATGAAEDLLPERALAGDPEAREALVERLQHRSRPQTRPCRDLDRVRRVRRVAGGDRPRTVRPPEHRSLPAAPGGRRDRVRADRPPRPLGARSRAESGSPRRAVTAAHSL